MAATKTQTPATLNLGESQKKSKRFFDVVIDDYDCDISIIDSLHTSIKKVNNKASNKNNGKLRIIYN
jgi:hypothetical protein